MSLRGQFANWLWQSVTPVPSAPLPKGGWHGEAVTGGFFSPSHPGRAHRPCPTRRCVIGPGRTGSSAPTRNSVGADAYIGPLYRTPCKNPCHCEPVIDSLVWQSASPVPKTTAHFIFPYSLKSPSLPHSSHFFHIFPVAKYCPTPYNKLCDRFVTFPHKKPVFLIERNL